MAVGNIDLSRVNISLAEFQKMSDGKYNANEVKLSNNIKNLCFPLINHHSSPNDEYSSLFTRIELHGQVDRLIVFSCCFK